jgi:manganese/zinc/iron transport system permease protein
MIIGSVSAVLGYYSAYLLDASIAGCMISVAGVLFILVFLLSPTHGVLWRKRKMRKMAAT